MVPEIVFIVPYRKRAPQKKAFECVMKEILEDLNYKVIFIHQNDLRPFNRGAIKNIGFIYVKSLYPREYKNINLVFHDIDYIPYKKGQFDYTTEQGVVRHYFGYTNTLGGFFTIKAGDFEKINGFPNIWTWGLEDNVIQKRVLNAKFKINRTNFLHATKDEDKLITLWHGWDRLINKKIFQKFTATSNYDGLRLIKNLRYIPETLFDNFSIIHVNHFETGENFKVASKDAKVMKSYLNREFEKFEREKPKVKEVVHFMNRNKINLYGNTVKERKNTMQNMKKKANSKKSIYNPKNSFIMPNFTKR